MKTALEYAVRRGGCLPRGIHFDVRDNYKDIYANQGLVGSSQSAVQSEYAGTGISTAPISVADSSNINVDNSSRVTTTVNTVDPGAIAAAAQIARDALNTGAQNVADASRTILEAFKINTDLAKQAQSGPVGMITKVLAWVLVAVGVIWGATKIFGKGK